MIGAFPFDALGRPIREVSRMQFVPNRPYSDPEKAARTIVEIANATETGQEGRICIELINGPFLFREKGTPDEYKAGLDLAIERGWLVLHESETFVTLVAVAR